MIAEKTFTLNAGDSVFRITEDGAVSFSLAGKHLWSSDGPFCLLHFYDRQQPRADAVPAPWDNSRAMGTAGTPSLSARSSLRVEQTGEREIRVTAAFESIEIDIDIAVELLADGSGFVVRVDEAGLREHHPSLYRVLGIEILPEFGAARSGENGYLLLPNWFGCRTYFDKTYPREVVETVYSSNDQWEYVCNMPVFGITRGQGTLCGLISKGDYDAELVCRQHWEAKEHNSVHPKLNFRWQQQDDLVAGPREVRYTFAPPDYDCGEGYVFCGKEYRKILRERGVLTWEEKRTARPDGFDYSGRFFLKIFMACKDPQADGKGTYHPTCTFDQVIEILSQCQSRGMDRMTAIIVGWGQDGHDGKCPTYFPPDERLGGEAGIKRLISWCKDHDVQLGVHSSHNAVYSCSEEFDLDDIMRHRTGEPWQSVIWSGGQCYKACPQVSRNKYVKRDIPRLAALGMHGHHHYDAVGSFELCYSPLHPVTTRTDYINLVREEFQEAIDHLGSVSTEMPFGPYFDLVDGFFHSYLHPSPWHLASPIGRFFYDESAPLLTVALHGSLNCGMGMVRGKDYLLEMLDMGLTPQSEVSMSPAPQFGIPDYASKADALAETYYSFLGPDGILPRLNNLTIEARFDRAPGISETRYSDGTVVIVNRSDAAYDGVPAKRYVIR